MTIKGPQKNQEHRQGKAHYQSKDWKQKKNEVWHRDQSLCQLCKKKGIIHQLTRGTKDLNRQGTVDHIIPINAGGSDELTNLWLIGSIHHARKSNLDKKLYY